MAFDNAAKKRMLDATRRRAQEEEYGNAGTAYQLPDGRKFWKLQKSGFDYTKEFDVLPYKITDPKHPDVRAGRSLVGDYIDARKVYTHPNLGPNEDTYLCLETWGEECPCALAGDKYRHKERDLRNIFDYAEQDKGIQFWDISVFCFSQLLNKEIKADDDNPKAGRTTPYSSYWWPEDGYTLQVRFEKGAMPNVPPFPKAGRIDFLGREPYAENDPIFDQVISIDDVLKKPAYDHLARMMGVEVPEQHTHTREVMREGSQQTTRQAPTGEARRRTVQQEPPPPEEQQGKVEHPIDPDQDQTCIHKFGVDTDTKPECGECPSPLWDNCRDQRDRLALEAAKQKPVTRGGTATTSTSPTRRRAPAK